VTVSRRTFIFAGVLGVAALAVSRYWPRSTVESAQLRSLSLDGEAVMYAIVPVMLADALPNDSHTRHEAVRATIANIDRAVDGLSPQQIAELGHLFALLTLAPVRWSLIGSMRSWQDATSDEVERFLVRLRDSRIALLRAAYDALHQLVFSAWYGDPRAWPAIGYEGPPKLD
jgi:hypothetical protein